MNLFLKEIEPGDKLLYTDDIAQHLSEQGVFHGLDYGDEVVVIARDDTLPFPVCITDPRNLTWRAHIYLTVAEEARNEWLIAQGYEPSDPDGFHPLFLERKRREFAKLSSEDRRQKWEELRQQTLKEALEAWKKYRPDTYAKYNKNPR